MAEMANCSQPSPTDVIFVAMDALVERIHVEDLIAKRNATAMSYPSVVHLNCRNSTTPRPDRSRVSGTRSEAFGDLIFLDHGSTKSGDQTCFGWCYCKLNSISM